MIVLNSIQRTVLLTYLEEFKVEMKSRGIDCRPVLIKSGDYILPETMLTSNQWTGIFKVVQGWIYRNVLENEFITINPI